MARAKASAASRRWPRSILSQPTLFASDAIS
jgi:hypothetical protein